MNISNTPPNAVPSATCSAGCKRTGPFGPNGEAPPGWEQLAITGRWRCPVCTRELTAARQLPGTPGAYTPDPLPKDDRGALKKLPEPPPLREDVKP